MEEEQTEKKAVRVFVGGLGEAVTSEDLRRLFESLGTVQSLETIRTKGRSLAYLDFLSDPKSLSKLFSKYNGCVWKGGKLRLEKAKEHYLDRMKKEWEEEKRLSIKPPATQITTQKEDLVKEKPNSRRILDSTEKPLNIYFPRLRTVKSIPFSGTGKHKYSFQNIKVPPLPVHFCDCEEHCSPFIPKTEKLSMNAAAEIGGINDEEINIMNAVMNKLLEKEKVSNSKQLEKKHDSFESPDALQSNKGEVENAIGVDVDDDNDDGDDGNDDDDGDDDGLIINIATKKKKAALTGTQELEKILENQEWSNKTNIAEEEPIEVQKTSNNNPNKAKKRKPLPKSESNNNEGASSVSDGKSKMQTLLDEMGSGAQPTEPGYDLGESGKVSWSQKSSWRELVGKGGNASFSASLILPKFDSGKQQNSDETEDMESDESQPEDMESDESRPEDVESDESQPEDVESDESQPEDVESDESQPEDVESDESYPEDVESDESHPEDVESDESHPEDVESDESQPEDGESESDESQPEDAESDESQPEDEESDESQPEDMESDESQPEDMESDESQPSHAQVTEEPAEAQPTNAHVIEEPAESQPANSQMIEEPAEAQPTTKQVMTEPAEAQYKTAPKITGRGSSWLQKESWTQLVNKDNNSFSISQILPDITFPEQTAKEPILYPVYSNNLKHNGADRNTNSGTVIDGFNLGEIVPEKSEHAGADDIVSAPVAEKTVETNSREGSSANVEIGETCSFMRSAASLKEWAKAKAALSGSLKRKHSEK